MIRKVLFFGTEDPRKASSWSNVPNRFIHALEKRGIEVVAVQLLPYPKMGYLWDYFFRRILKVLLQTELRYFNRTRLAKWLGERVIQKTVRKHADADLCIFIGYQFVNRFNDIPSLLFSDWSNEIAFERAGKFPSFFERRNLEQERKAICHAKYVVSMFPVCAKRMKELYPEANILYLGGNVVNNFYDKDLEEEEVLKRKRKSHAILFVGKPDRYKESAIKVMEAFKFLRERDINVQLHVVGIRPGEFKTIPDGVTCHGFLHKDDEMECQEYYNLLLDAKVIVNPTPQWAAYSSLIEAMYFYTPVVVSPYKDFVEEFGPDIPFGCYNEDYSVEGIQNDLERVLQSSEYDDLCKSAHHQVQTYTWEDYVGKLLNSI